MHVQAKLCHGIVPPIWYKNFRNESFANEATNATQNDSISRQEILNSEGRVGKQCMRTTRRGDADADEHENEDQGADTKTKTTP